MAAKILIKFISIFKKIILYFSPKEKAENIYQLKNQLFKALLYNTGMRNIGIKSGGSRN
jgi:hypothetical protein